MNWNLPNPGEMYEMTAACALVCVIAVWVFGPVFGPLLLVIILAMAAHIGKYS